MTDTKRKSRAKKDATENPGPTEVTKDPQTPGRQREDMIALSAYYKAQERGFAIGLEMQDWLEAERELDENFIQK
jgi:hypothetical protein